MSFPKRTPANRRAPRLPRSRTTTSRMATSPRRNAIAATTTISRYEPLVDEGLIPTTGSGLRKRSCSNKTRSDGFDSAELDQTLAEIFSLDEPDAFDIEQMRAPASSRQRNRQLRGDQQRYHDHRNRHGADPVQPHRR